MNTPLDSIQEIEKVLIDNGATLVKACPDCYTEPLQLWQSDKPIDLETRRRIASTRSNVDTMEVNQSIQIVPWEVEDDRLWKYYDVPYNESRLKAVDFYNSKIGWVAGSYGTVLKTTNGGSDWVQQKRSDFSLPVYEAINDIQFLDSMTGWAVGEYDGELEYGFIYKTINGGESWEEQISYSKRNFTGYYKDVHFINDQIGWVVGGYPWNGGLGTIIKTVDGGKNWEEQIPDENIFINGVWFLNRLTGWAIGEGGTILKTENGGNNWVTQNSNVSVNLNKIQFIDQNYGWVVGEEGVLLRSHDGGLNWEKLNSGSSIELHALHFFDHSIGWIAGAENTLMTRDGGKTWTRQSSIGGNDIDFVDEENGWITNGGLIKYYPPEDSLYYTRTPREASDTVKVAIIDSGVETSHFLLQDALSYSYDFLYNNNLTSDIDGHGTSVSGAVVRDFPDSLALELMDLKFFENGRGTVFEAVCAIYCAIRNKADVINMSWGFESQEIPKLLYDALEEAQKNGVLVVTTAGNEAKDNDIINKYPANLDLDNIIVVTAHQEDNESNKILTEYANYGKQNVDVSAEGYLYTVVSGGVVAPAGGTSMAAPIVARTAAVIMGLYPELTYQEVRDCIFSTVDPLISPEGKEIKYGALNHEAAVACATDKVNPVNLNVLQFNLIDNLSGDYIQIIEEGDTLNLAILPDQINLEAVTPNTLGSIQLSLNGPNSYNMLRNSAPYYLFSEPAQFLEEGEYQITAKRFAIIDLKGREGQTKEVNFSVINRAVTSLELELEKGLIQLYPNPVSKGLLVDWTKTNHEQVALSLYNSQGKEVRRYVPDGSGKLFSLDMSMLSKGIYLLKIQIDNEVITRKIMRE